MNERITSQAHAEVIAGAIELLPGRLAERLAHVAFFTSDPIAAGLHDTETHDSGLSYREVAHVCYATSPWHFVRPLGEHRTTVVVPTLPTPGIVVHELGHALHEVIDFAHVPAVAVTDYAASNDHERFAEAFTAWVLPESERAYGTWDFEEMQTGRRLLLADDRETVRLFETLAYD